jgi:hypothetical protein
MTAASRTRFPVLLRTVAVTVVDRGSHGGTINFMESVDSSIVYVGAGDGTSVALLHAAAVTVVTSNMTAALRSRGRAMGPPLVKRESLDTIRPSNSPRKSSAIGAV